MKNLIERLQEVQTKEVKRKDTAVRCLEELTQILAPIMLEIEGEEVDPPFDHYSTEAIWIPTWNKEKNRYDLSNTSLYFRYDIHNGDYKNEDEGFYIESRQGQPLWGTDLLDVRGTTFWTQVKIITDWVINYLPEYIENKDKSRDKRLEQLEKVISTLRTIK